MPYTAPTLASMVDDLSRSLGDPGKVFFVQDELERYCREALRTWNCYASYWRARRQFPTAANTHFYDLVGLGLLSAPSDQAFLLNDLQYAMVEPFSVVPPPFDTFPTTEQYSSAQINSALVQALKQFQFDSGMRLSVEPDVAVPTFPSYQAELDENVADVRHLELRVAAPGTPIDGKRFPLRRTDEFSAQYWEPSNLLDAGAPYGYNVVFPNTQPTVRVIPPSSLLGLLTPVVIRSDAFPPTDYQWPAKWLALHYLLTMDGQSRDHARAQYCKKRYADAMLIASLVPSVAVAYINDRPAPIVSPSDLDDEDPGWRSRTLAAGQLPDTVVAYGWNLLGVHPTPTLASPIHSISFDMFVEAPVADDPIQIAPEHLQAVLDYAKHIACFKMGGSEFSATTPLMERFVMEAAQYNSRLSAESRNLWTMRDRAARDKEQRYLRRSQDNSSEQVFIEEGGQG